MFAIFAAVLLIFHLVLAEEIPNCCDSLESKTLASNIYDDTVLKDIQRRLDLLQTTDENLRLRIDSLNIILDQQFTLQRKEFKKSFDDLISSFTATKTPQKPTRNENQENCEDSVENLIDIRGDFENEQIDSNACQRTKTTKTILPQNCAEALKKNGRNGVYKIRVPDSKIEPFYVHCIANVVNAKDYSNNTAPWMMIQRRQDGSIDFYRSWAEYQLGFGNLEGEFFLGLDKIYALTQSNLHELWIQMEDSDGAKRWAKYSSFAIGSENQGYALNILGTYTGDSGDSLHPHAGQKWTTKDRDNDAYGENCAVNFVGAWWYKACHESNLNGKYGDNSFGKGINWFKWHGHTYSLKYVHMAIRPVQ